MSKIHYIYQMNAFLEWRKRDHLSANTVLVYLTIFQTFNRDYWQHEWLPMSVREVMNDVGSKSSSNIVLGMNVLKELGYIETRVGKRGNKQHTEIRLVPLYDNSNNLGTNEDMPENTFDKIPASFDKLTPDSTRNTVPVSGTKTGTVTPNTVPVSGAKTGTVPPNTVPVSGAKTGTVPTNTVPVSGAKTGTVATNTVPVSGAQTGTVSTPAVDTVPVTVPVIVPVSDTKTGTVNTSNPLCHRASQSPNIDKDKDKDFHSVNSSQYDSIHTENSSKNGSIHTPTEEDYYFCFNTYNVCVNREPTYDEKMALIKMVRKYSAKEVIDVLNKLYEKALNESPEIIVTSHKRGKPDSLHITLEACEKLLWQRKMGLDKPMPRRTEPVKGWEDFRPA